MKACVLHNIGDLRYEEVGLPDLAGDQVRLHIRAAGICGSDLSRVFTKGTYHFPTIPGHEFAGEIVEAADEKYRPLIGRKAAVFPLIPCRSCAACEVGEYAQCESYDYYGSRRDGGFAEYLNVNVWNLVLMDDSVSYEEAAMCEPCAVAVHALSQAGIRLGDTVVISGTGTIGLMLAYVARAWGAEKVILLDVDREKVEFARLAGFSHVINTNETDPREYVGELTGGRGADVVVEGCGVSASLENCLEAAANFGRVVLMGNPAGAMSLPMEAYWQILRKNLTLKGTWNSSFNGMVNDWKTAAGLMESGKVDFSKLITHRYSFDRCQEAFQMLRDRREFAVKVMFINEEERYESSKI